MIIIADLKVDLSNLPERIFVDMRSVTQTVCKQHFLKYFLSQGESHPGAYIYKQLQVYKVCAAPEDDSCLACASSVFEPV
jgi:hypothetical protein